MIETIILTLNSFIYLLNFVFSIFFVYIFIIDITPFKILNQMFNNWELSPISDFYINNNNFNNSCKNEYEKAFIYQFPGMNIGCDCTHSNSGYLNNNKIIGRDCYDKEIKDNCENINPINEYNFSDFNNLSICIKRDNFFKYQFIKKEKECEEYYKSCGIVDSLGYHYCIFNESECDYNFTNYENDYNNLTNVFQSFVEFKLSQGKLCLDNSKFISYSDLPLTNKINSTKCENFYSNYSIDNRYQEILTLNTKNLLEKEIKILNSTNNFFEDFLKNNITLYGRKYIGWKDKCYSFLDEISPLKELVITRNYEFVFLCLSSFFSLFFFICCGIIMIECSSQKTETGLSVIFVHSIILVDILYYSSKYYDIYIKINPTIDQIIELQCSDLYTTLSFFVMKKYLLQFISTLFGIIMIIIAILVLEFCAYVVFLYDIIKDHLAFFYFNGQSVFDVEFNFLN